MIYIYLYSRNPGFKDITNSTDIDTYWQYKNTSSKPQLVSNKLDYLVNNELKNICFGFTEKEENALSLYFDDIVIRQKENTSTNFIIRTLSVNILRDVVSYVKNGTIKVLFIKISIEGIQVSFNNDNCLVSEDSTLKKILNWINNE